MPPREIRLTLPAWVDHEVDMHAVYADDEARVGLAIRLAQRNIEERSGGPFGAAVFDERNRIVAVGVNLVLPQQCSVAHAETVALMAAQSRLGRARLNEDGRRYTLAASAQPCVMCYGATFWAGIDSILIGARASDVMELTEFDEGPLPEDWIGELEKRDIVVSRDILREAARAVLMVYAGRGGRNY